MATSYIKVFILGALATNPEMKYMTNGRPVTNFTVPTNRRWKNKDGSQGDETVWNKIAVFGGQAEACNKMLSKGSVVLVEARPNPNQDGNPRTFEGRDGCRASYEYIAERVQFVDKFGSSGGSTEEEYEDIPF